MDAAKQDMDLELQEVEQQLANFNTLSNQVPVDPEALCTLLQTMDLQIEDYQNTLKIYLGHCRKNNKDAEYTDAVKKKTDIRMKRITAGNIASKLMPNGSGTSSASGGSATPDSYRVHLPKRELQKFDGDVRNWRSFWASFTEIDTDPHIPSIEKYHYLLQSMVPNTRPYQVVSSYPADGPSYKLAKDELADKFGRPKTLIKVYMRDLLKLVVDNAKDNKAYNFVEMVTSLTAQTRNLEQLGLAHDKFGVVLYPIVESCIPQEVLNRYLQIPNVKEEIKDILDFLNEEVRRRDETALAQSSFSSTSCRQKGKQGKSANLDKHGKHGPPTAVSFLNADGKGDKSCGFCGGKHPTTECRKAVSMTIDERKQALLSSRSCLKCLQPGHWAKKCKSPVVCIGCKKSHHTLMCWNLSKQKENDHPAADNNKIAVPVVPSTGGNSDANNSNTVQMANYINKPEVLLQTLCVRMRYAGGEKKIRIMIDSASQSTYIRKALVQELQLKYLGREQVIHQTFGAVFNQQVEHLVYTVEIAGLHQSYQQWYSFMASSIDDVGKKILAPPEGPWIKECHDRGIKLSDTTGSASDIDMLIGGDIAPYLLVGMQSVLLPSNLIARESKLGWFLEGKIKGTERSSSTKAMVCVNMMLSNTDVSKLWSLDVLGIKDAFEPKSQKELEEAAVEHFLKTVTQKPDGRYRVHLPWIEGHPSLQSNRAHATARLYSTTKQLISDNRLNDYHTIFMSWLEEGIIELVPDITPAGPVHYLPHRAVYKENSTTPTRPVFNASSKQKNNVSLNDCLETGPNLLEKIPSTITSFRLETVGVIADIKKAFLQIEVVEDHRDSMRFLWWLNVDERRVIVEFRHCRVVFGATSSPFLLAAVLQHLLEKSEKQYPDTVKLLKSGFYVDNVVTSVPSLLEAEEFKRQATTLLSAAQFDLRGWEFGPVPQEKLVPVLGLIWNTKLDTLQFDISRLEKKPDTTSTKRTLLMFANGLFDPLGWISPFTITVKMLFKKVCVDSRKFTWDTPLPEEYQAELEQWRKQLKLVPHVHIPRYVGTSNTTRKDWSLHCFNDASKSGYATCVYLRINGNPVHVTLLQSRARVTPEKVLTIPRGELLACLIGARLTAEVKKDLEMSDIPVTYWSDSSTALTWIRRTDAVWGTFVNNRVKEIRQITDIDSWKHVPGSMNPADLPSRGIPMEKLISCRWSEGPSWLYQSEETFPNSNPDPEEEVVNTEKKKMVVSSMAKRCRPTFIADLVRLGSYNKILRVISYTRRFVKNKFIQTIPPLKQPIPVVTITEMKEAEILVIRYIQQSTWGNQPPAGFLYEIDHNQIIRIVTRLIRGKDCADFQKPALLPGDNQIVKMLIYSEHFFNSHAGVQFMQSFLREKYWITNSRRTIRNIIRNCPICRVHSAKRCQVPEAPLPRSRIELGKCFQTVGVDLAGPLFLRNAQKVWIVIFTCAVYRAVHFEVVASASTAAFINSLRKFVARRGRPSTIYSDNGTNFHGAGNLLAKVNWKLIQQQAAVKEIRWIFNPPTGAWWGGYWERLIGMMKQLLRRTLGKRTVDLDELEVLVAEAESVMNDRPLTYVSEDPNDLRPLTPAMFLRDLPVASLPDVDLGAKELNRRLRYCLNLKEELKRRFRSEYLGQLVSKGKSKKIDKLSIGDVVLVETDNKKRLEWPIGIVVQTYPGKDGHVRTVKVRTTHGELLRPIQRLFQLELQGQNVVVEAGKELPLEAEQQEIKESELSEGEAETGELLTPEAEPIITRSGRKIQKPDRLRF